MGCCLELKRDEAALLFEHSTPVSELADAMSPQRHKLAAPIVVSYGVYETPEFQRQARDFAAAVKAAGRPVELIEGQYHHDEMAETFGSNPLRPPTAAPPWQ